MTVEYKHVYFALHFLMLFPSFSIRSNWKDASKRTMLDPARETYLQKENQVSKTSSLCSHCSWQLTSVFAGFDKSTAFATAYMPKSKEDFEKHRSDKVKAFSHKRARRRRFKNGLKRSDGRWTKRKPSGQYSTGGKKWKRRSNMELEKDSKKLETILKQLQVQNDAGPEEACGTRWTKSANEEWNSKFQPLKSYGTIYESKLSNDNRNRRHAPDVIDDARSSAVYFSGNLALRWSPTRDSQPSTPHLNISMESFTAELWIKPDGGQLSPAVILGMGGISPRSVARAVTSIWTLGIQSREEGGDSRAVYYFTMENRHNGSPVTIFSTNHYKPEDWTHLAVTVNYTTMKLFVNSVQVAVSDENEIHVTKTSVPNQQNTLVLGGNVNLSDNFRGVVSHLRVWKQARSQIDIRKLMYNLDEPSLPSSLVVYEDFGNIEDSWVSSGDNFPEKVVERTPQESDKIHFPELRAPTCGQTVCDNPDIVRSYVSNWSLRKKKTLRYSVISVNDDDGANPMLTLDNVLRQNALLCDVFEKHNITWVPTLINVNNSSLRHKTIGCEPTKIGNRECNRECMHARLGHDGGDCDVDESACDPSRKGDGHCDIECNKIYHDWDFGDCCDPQLTDTDETCFDPDSPHRAYLSVTEYRDLLGADNSKQLSVLFANWTNPNSIGISTFPWDKNVFTSQGGTVVQLKSYTRREEISGLVHELGHNLGLLHVHHGTHDVTCDDTCVELRASMTTGDLCEDTNPTPMNTECREPNNTETFCNKHNYTRTPYNNFMSYADGSCQENFTPQQRARMHCYIDLVYDSWKEVASPSPIPLPPKIVASSRSKGSITFSWPPPIDGRVVGVGHNCDSRCNPDGSLRQYAINSSSLDASVRSGWSASQATGPPDQEPCTLRGMHFWMPSGTSGTNAECGSRCFIDLQFQDAVIPSLLRIWVTYGTEDGQGIKKVEIQNTDDTTTVLSALHSHCDVPLTARIKTNKTTKRIRVYVDRPYTAIDAVEMISEEKQDVCSECRAVKYKIHRNPPFPDNSDVITEQLSYTDSSCEDDVAYSYAVQPILLEGQGELSPHVHFRLGQTFCGDGEIQIMNSDGKIEQCDDGNMENGDGCDIFCQLEKGFHCKGRPSLCYWHDGDGICDDIEKMTKHRDCSTTPVGYLDQWAVEAFSSSAALEALHAGRNRQRCSRTNETLGPPDSSCGKSVADIEAANRAWMPCIIPGLTTSDEEHWIKMMYQNDVQPTSVLIYFASIEEMEIGAQKPVTLVLPNNEVISTDKMNLSCDINPVMIDIPPNKDRQSLKELIIKFSSYNAAIDAVALRSKVDIENLQVGSGALSSKCVMNLNFDNANITCNENGKLYSDVALDRIWLNETKCTIDCKSGYLPKSTQKVECKEGMWNADVKCIPISCGAPSHVKFASFSCPSGYKLNAFCNFTCWSRAKMIGSNNQFRCEENGLWSPPSAYCEPLCSLPPTMAFATAGCHALSNRPSRPGETCKYRCKAGYRVTQQPVVKRTYRLTCGADGAWTGPGCQPVLCPELPSLYSGKYTCTRGIMFGSVCSMVCQEEESEILDIIRCGSDGQWNASFTLCPQVDIVCEAPISSPGIEITCTGFNTGQTCEASCTLKEGSNPYDIVSSTQLQNRESQMQEPKRKTRTLVCMGKEWFPNPEQLYCIDECSSQFIGDKWCDPNNNRAYCDWDGGDCCESTTTGKRVERFPSTCSVECECKDPEAIENNPIHRDGSNPLSVEEEMRNRVILLPLSAPLSQEIPVLNGNKHAADNIDNNSLEEQILENSGKGHHGVAEPETDVTENESRPQNKKKKRTRENGMREGRISEDEGERIDVDSPVEIFPPRRSRQRIHHHRESPKHRRHAKRSSRARYKDFLD